MGFNTSMIILNDCLDDIAKDPEFGATVARKVKTLPTEFHICDRQGRKFYGSHVPAGGCCSAARVIETHHADSTSIIAVGRNEGIVLSAGLYAYREEERNISLLRTLADQYGFTLRKKPTR